MCPMHQTEDLRAALVELDRLRDRERVAAHESKTLFQLLDGLSTAANHDDAIVVLIERAQESLKADTVALLGATEGAKLSVLQASDPALIGLVWPAAAELLSRPRRMTDLHARDWGVPVPAPLSEYRALMVAGIAVVGETPLMLACLSRRPAAFGASDIHLLLQVTRIAGPALERLRLARRNALLREELQLAHRREVLGQLASGLVHDFNNILAVVTGSAGMIEARHISGGADANDAARILEAAEQATKLIARLRDLGRHGGSCTEIDLRKQVTKSAELLRGGLHAAHRLVLSLPEAPLMVYADPVEVLQVVLNLAINARDALRDGPGEITLSVAPTLSDQAARSPDVGRLRPGRPCMALQVTDTGIGMTPEACARVFEPWFSTKGTLGTGLGLAVVANIVRANDAALWLDSVPCKGTQVTIFWPVMPEAAPEAALDSMPPANVRPERLDGLRLMVVDDAELVCTVLASILKQAGAEVATATDPAKARDVIAEDPGRWAALITDQDMPGMSGSVLARAVRSIAPKLPVLLVSALPDAAEAELFDAILAKPVPADTLVAAVARAVK